jgi:hypothetical protein
VRRDGGPPAFLAPFEEPVVEADGEAREGLDGFEDPVREREGVLNVRLEPGVELSLERLVVPLQEGGEAEELGGVGGGGTGLGERLEATGDGAFPVGVAEGLEEGRLEGVPGLNEGIVSQQVGFEPRESGASEVGSREEDFGAVVWEKVWGGEEVEVEVRDKGAGGRLVSPVELGGFVVLGTRRGEGRGTDLGGRGSGGLGGRVLGGHLVECLLKV